MKRPLWFRRHGLHWTPCAWQGWLLVAVYTLFLVLVVFRWVPVAPALIVPLTIVLTALLIAIAFLTDDTPRRS